MVDGSNEFFLYEQTSEVSFEGITFVWNTKF